MAMATTSPAGMSDDLVRVTMLGQTGGGKSKTAQKIVEHLGHCGLVFQDSDGDKSHTKAPVSVVVGGTKVTDNPGLMDSGGRAMDIKNMELIVNTVRAASLVILLHILHDRSSFLIQLSRQSPTPP